MAAALVFSLGLAAQPGTGDSLKAAIAGQRAAVALADSTHDPLAAFNARLQLAVLVRKGEAVALLRQASALADSMGRPGLGAEAHGLLAARLAAAGDPAGAYAEALVADSLERLRAAGALDSLKDRQAALLGGLAARDSAVQAGRDRERHLAEALVEVQRSADLWMRVAFGLVALLLLAVMALLYRTGGKVRKLRGTVQDLRNELAALKQPGTGRAGPGGGGRSMRAHPPAEKQPAPGSGGAIDQAMKPVVSGMFRKDAPQRLEALRQARRQGDRDKVLRVLATLKPQLVHYNEPLFGPLLQRLRAPGAPADAARWNADLDQLESGVEDLLRNGPGH